MGSFSLSLFLSLKKKENKRKKKIQWINEPRWTGNLERDGPKPLLFARFERWSMVNGITICRQEYQKGCKSGGGKERSNLQAIERKKKKKRNWTKYWNDYDYDDCYVSFRFRTETEDPIVTLRYLEVRRFARCYKKKESVYLIFYFYRIWGNAVGGMEGGIFTRLRVA